MATQAYPPAGATDDVSGTTSLDNFIPELWSDEIIASFKGNLVLANLVSSINHTGKKGDTINIPTPTRDDANEKAEATGVTIISNVEGTTQITIDQHWEYTRLIEDLAALQAINSYRNFYTDDAGYSLATRNDRELWLETTLLQGGAATRADLFEQGVIGGDGSTAFSGASSGNGTSFTDAGIRQMIQTLDDADVPMSERFLVIPPVEKNSLMGIPRFTEQAFVGEGGAGNTIRNGLVGELYGVPVYVSTQVPWLHANSVTNNVQVNFSGTLLSVAASATQADEYSGTVDWSTSTPTDTTYRACLMAHRSALVNVPQQSIRTQTQYKQEYLADLFTADMVFGTGELRDDAGLVGVVPSGVAAA